MSKRPPGVTETELEILDVLWERGPSEVREIAEAIYHEHTPALHATVKSLLERLGEKGFVSCDRSRFRHKFAAAIGREAFVGRQLELLAETHFNGSLAPMLLTLVERVKLKPAEREAIRKIIEGIRP